MKNQSVNEIEVTSEIYAPFVNEECGDILIMRLGIKLVEHSNRRL